MPERATRRLLVLTRIEALQKGLLVDMTQQAHQLGLRFPVAASRLVWGRMITASGQAQPDHYPGRVREVLLALRLHVETQPIASAWIEFPVLLSFPPNEVPQLCSLYAVALKEPDNSPSLRLLLPQEVSHFGR